MYEHIKRLKEEFTRDNLRSLELCLVKPYFTSDLSESSNFWNQYKKFKASVESTATERLYPLYEYFMEELDLDMGAVRLRTEIPIIRTDREVDRITLFIYDSKQYRKESLRHERMWVMYCMTEDDAIRLFAPTAIPYLNYMIIK